MRNLLILLAATLLALASRSQTMPEIINELKEINSGISSQPCSTGKGKLISNRAMNVFLADKTGYLSERGDLSLYTNYVTLNTTLGELSVNHNFHTATGKDEPVRSFISVGVKANVADGFAATFQDRKFNKELGLMISYTLLGNAKTSFVKCRQAPNASSAGQKSTMDVLRSSLFHSLEQEIKLKSGDFERSLEFIDVDTEAPGLDLAKAKEIARKKFYADLREEFAGIFAKLQAEILTNTKNYKTIRSSWTNFAAYIPLVSPKYDVAKTITSNFEEKKSFPFELKLSHTRLWEWSKFGRVFFSVSGKLSGNNSRNSYQLDKVIIEEYKNLGGIDTLRLAQLGSRPAYIGSFENFLRPAISARVTYFPPEWHLGISYLIEQHFGDFKTLNGRLGIPVVLINNKRLPALNFEFQVLFFDLTNQIQGNRKYDNNTAIGMSVGFPMSRLIY